MNNHPIPYQGFLARYEESRSANARRAVENDAVVRATQVRADAFVQREMLHEIDRLTRTAMSGQTMLRQWRGVLAQGDPFADDELRFFTDVARMGKGEVIAATIDRFTRKSEP